MTIVCHSDLHYCCNGPQGIHRGDWYFPNGTVLPFSGNNIPIGLGRSAQRVVIRRTTATGPTGIYRCDIPTNAVHDDTDISVRETVYVGLYPTDGMQVLLSRTVSLLCRWRCHNIWRGSDILTKSPSPVSPLEDLLPPSLGPETPQLSLKELRLC